MSEARPQPEQALRVAVLGGTGFAGKNLRDALEAVGMSVGVFSRTTGCDLLDLPTAWRKLDEFRPDYIVNCAALVGSVNYVADFAADVVDVNMRIALNTYKIAQQMREVVIVNPIANCAYPGVMDTYREENFWDGPVHPTVLSYGNSRRMLLVLSKCYFDQYGVRSINLITPNMYGPYDSTNPNKTHALNALIIKFVRAVKHKTSPVEVWGTGKPVREWLFVKDFAALIRSAIQTREKSPAPVNLAQNRGYSVSELVALISKHVQYQGEIVYNPRYPDGSPKKVMDDRQFRQRFPDFTFTSIDTAIQSTIEYYLHVL